MGIVIMAPAMKAMKARAKPTGLTATAAFSKIAETTELKPKNVKAVIVSYMELAASELKKNAATAARKGVNPFTKEPCVFKAKPASKTVRALPMKKFKLMVN